MKRSRIFMGVGTIALLVSSIFAVKASKKNAFAGTVCYNTTGGTYPIAWNTPSGGAPIVTTTTSTGHVAYFNAAGHSYTLVTSVSHTKLYATF